jgi:hypothetical protein
MGAQYSFPFGAALLLTADLTDPAMHRKRSAIRAVSSLSESS